MLEGAKQPFKHVSIADYLKLELCICIFSSYSVLACSFIIIIIIYLFFCFGGGGYAGVFRVSEVFSIRMRDVSIFDFMKV